MTLLPPTLSHTKQHLLAKLSTTIYLSLALQPTVFVVITSQVHGIKGKAPVVTAG